MFTLGLQAPGWQEYCHDDDDDDNNNNNNNKTKHNFLIDMAVPNTHNLAKTITDKQNKYQELAN